VSDAQSGVESRLRGLLSRGEEAAGRSIGALRGRIQTYMEPKPPPRPARRSAARTRRRHK
jgi:hypothetical protein